MYISIFGQDNKPKLTGIYNEPISWKEGLTFLIIMGIPIALIVALLANLSSI